MKLKKQQFDELNEAQKKEVLAMMGECYNTKYFTNEWFEEPTFVGIDENMCIYYL